MVIWVLVLNELVSWDLRSQNPQCTNAGMQECTNAGMHLVTLSPPQGMNIFVVWIISLVVIMTR